MKGFDKMRVFQILKNEVLVKNNDLEYSDTLDNFKLDSGLSDLPEKVIYDNYQECCVVRVEKDGDVIDDFQAFPNETFDGYIDNVQTYIDKKDARTPDPEPPELTEEEKIENEAYTAKSKINTLANKMSLAVFTGADTSGYKTQYTSILSEVSDEASLQMVDYFPVWSGNGVSYGVGQKVQYDGVLYSVLQAHTSQADWTPTTAVSLFAKVLTSESGEPLPWEQPDSTNGYKTGDKVIYNGKIYQSTIDNNVWSPEAYPAGWELIGDAENTDESA